VCTELEGVLACPFWRPETRVAGPGRLLGQRRLVSKGQVQGCIQAKANVHSVRPLIYSVPEVPELAVRSVMGILLQSARRRNWSLPARRAHQRRAGSACPVPEDPGWVTGQEPAPGRRLPSCPHENVSRLSKLQDNRARGRVPLPVLGEREHAWLGSVANYRKQES
jgi:hypothetical protein